MRPGAEQFNFTGPESGALWPFPGSHLRAPFV